MALFLTSCAMVTVGNRRQKKARGTTRWLPVPGFRNVCSLGLLLYSEGWADRASDFEHLLYLCTHLRYPVQDCVPEYQWFDSYSLCLQFCLSLVIGGYKDAGVITRRFGAIMPPAV
jgi:hypothetical protein